MAGDLIRPNALPDRPNPVASEKTVVDNGVTVGGTTIEKLVLAGRPTASQVEAEAGTDPTKAMTPRTTRQAVTARIGVDIASKAQGDKADTAVQPGDLATVATSGSYNDLLDKPALSDTTAAESRAWAIASLHPTIAPPYIRTAGYATAGDGGGALYKKVMTEPAHAGKFSITLDDTVTVVWYEIAETQISLRQFGAKCDGVADDTDAFQECVDYAWPRGIPVIIPNGSTRITQTIRNDAPPYLIGERTGEWEWPAMGYDRKGSTIVSEVAGAYALDFGPESGFYAHGCTLKNFKIIAEGDALSGEGRGIRVSRCGWDGKIEEVVVQNFPLFGVTLDYMQDMHIVDLTITGCGKKTVAPSLMITGAGGGGSSNILVFDRLHIEETEYMMVLDVDTNNVVFNGAHFECGEYPPAPWLPEGHFTEHATIIIYGIDINFNDCIFGTNSVEFSASETGVTEDEVDYSVKVMAGIGVRFNRCNWASRGPDRTHRPLYINGTACEVKSCKFESLNIDKASIVLIGTDFTGNHMSFGSSGNANFHGILVSDVNIEGNTFFSSNNGDPDKTAGYIIEGNNGALSDLGHNKYKIQKAFKHHNSGFRAKGTSAKRPYVIATSTIDLELFDIAPVFLFPTAQSVTSMTGGVSGQEVMFQNQSPGDVTLSYPNVAQLSGGTNATIPVRANLTVQEGFNGLMYEKARSF